MPVSVLRVLGIVCWITLLAMCAHAEAPPCSDGAEGERQRIQQHLLRVEEWLRIQDTSWLSTAQRHARIAALDELDRYARAGVFPRNTTHAAGRIPIFVDPDGVRCAVAQLVAASGEEELVDAIARDFNTAYVPDIGSVELAAWARATGFTLHELEMIQPDYCINRQHDECTACYSDVVPQPPRCICEARPDGTDCDPDTDCNDGRCQAGRCMEDEEQCAPEEEEGCTSARRGSLRLEDALVAALFLGLALVLRRRRRPLR